MKCINAPRTFLNEDQCFLSTDANTCGSTAKSSFDIPLNSKSLRQMYKLSGGEAEGGRYVYAVDGLRVTEDKVAPPCKPHATSRWARSGCDGKGPKVSTKTVSTIQKLFAKSRDKNLFVTELWFPQKGLTCDPTDKEKTGFEITTLKGVCYKNVHPDHLQVYDMVRSSRDIIHLLSKLNCLHHKIFATKQMISE